MKKLYTRCLLSFVIAMGFTCAATAQSIKLLNPLPGYTHAYPGNFNYDTAASKFAVLNGVCYFAANTGNKNLRKLWRSDGTAAGTYMVTDKISFVNNIKVINNKIFISAGNDTWLSDGTDAGTELLNFNSQNGQGSDFIFFKGFVYYMYDLGLFKYDTLLKKSTLVHGVYQKSPTIFFSHFEVLDNCFLVNTMMDGIPNTLVSDGTAGGTVSLDIDKYNRNFTVLQNKAYFINGSILYSNPGSADAGASVPVNNPLNASVVTGYVNKNIEVLNNILYFPATTAATGTELYKYDPATPSGIMLVKDIIPGTGSANIDFNNMAVVNGALYFTVNEANGNRQLWKSDGTNPGTVLVKDFTTGQNNYFSNFTVSDTTLYFGFSDNVTGNELWKSDGTSNGTTLVKDINPGIYDANPAYITPFNNGLLFIANDGVHGTELWRTDGTGTGTALVKDINTTTPVEPLNMQFFTKFNNVLLFNATDKMYGTELWATDGTPAGTVLVKDINPGISSSNPSFLTAASDGIYFLTDSAGLHQLFKTNGTAAGTYQVKRFDSYSIQPFYISGAVSNLGFFWLSNNNNKELWRTDGTDAGTFKITNLANSTNVNNIQFSAIGNTGYFINGTDLWRTDGSVAGTVMEHHFTVMPSQLKVLKNTLVILTPDGLFIFNSNGFKQAGGPGRIQLLQEIKNRMFFYELQDVYDQDGYFSYTDYYLRAVDTAGNIKGIYDFADAPPQKFVLSGGKIYFSEESVSARLAILNDTTGTVTYNAKNFKAVDIIDGNGKLYFINFENGNNYSVGYSDGTYQGTQLVTDSLQPFFQISTLMVVNNHLLFTGNPASYRNVILGNFPSQLYALTIDAAILPVTLSSFTAKLQNGNGLLNWSTATEQNSDYFTVQRSTDGLHFSSVGKVAAAGNSTYKQEYNYTDYKLSQYGVDRLYYRLQQFDKDGKFTYSKIVPLNINTSFTASISPIPVANQLNINITSAKRQMILIQVVDMAGKTIASFSKTAEAGSTALSYNAAGWAKGIYQVHITQANGNKQTISVVR